MEAPHCFISYARQDLERVRPIVKLIEDIGWSVFWDRDIPTGLTWRGYIGKALDEAKCVIVVWSRYSVVSEFVQEEADDGRERKILIPVCIDKVRPPLGFRAIQHEDFTDWKGEPHHPRARNLIKSVERIAGKPEKSVAESSVTPMVEAEQETEGKFLKAKHNSKEPHENSSVAKIFISIALFIVVFAGLIYLLWPDPLIPDNEKPSTSIEQKQTLETQPAVTVPAEKFTKTIGMEFMLIPAGEFMMGSAISPEEAARRYDGNAEWYKREHPQRLVEIKKPFYMQKTEVTQGQWKKVMGDNPSYFKDCGDDCPVENVSWYDTQEFIKKLNDMDGTDTYRLPTEAEWEYAARAGTTTEFSFGDNAGKLGEYGWYGNNSGGKTHPVGKKQPNAFGLYDMHGNVWEWCEDQWHENYKGAPVDGSAWVDSDKSTYRVLRGGWWGIGAVYCRAAYRFWLDPGDGFNNGGFRLVRLPGQSGEPG